MMQSTQSRRPSTACNMQQQVHERRARWLLMTHDRMHEQEDFHLSYEFLAIMFGISGMKCTMSQSACGRVPEQRPTVSGLLLRCKKLNSSITRYARVTVRDPPRSRSRSRKCHGIVRAHFDRLRQ
jgi:hypothetical protein